MGISLEFSCLQFNLIMETAVITSTEDLFHVLWKDLLWWLDSYAVILILYLIMPDLFLWFTAS